MVPEQVHLWSVGVDGATLVEELMDDRWVVDDDQVTYARLDRDQVTVLLGPGVKLYVRLLHWDLQQIPKPRCDWWSGWLRVVHVLAS